MPNPRCKQCKKRLDINSKKIFCGIECEITYTNSTDLFCKNCSNFLGKSSVLKNKQFCNNMCHNIYQKNINKVEKICINCNKIFITRKSSHRYKLCSVLCEKEYAASDKRNKLRMDTLVENNLEKYGVKYTSQLPDFGEKVKKTKLEKHGDENYNNIKQIQQTCLERHGDYNPLKIKKFVDKAKQTKLEKYGKLNFNDISNVTKLKKYGTLNFSDKAGKTCEEKYGVTNAFQIPHVRDKAQKVRREIVLNNIFNGDRLKSVVIPLFLKEEYYGTEYEKKYKFRCTKCNTEFEDNLYSGHIPRCPICIPVIYPVVQFVFLHLYHPFLNHKYMILSEHLF